MEEVPPWLWAWLAAANVVAALAIVGDKRQARRGAARIPEAALLALAAFGGWPGAGLAMLAVRHKTRKQPFLARFLFLALVEAVAAVVLLDGFPR